jgi:poly(hydroxyalkanoate) depolymerase family esterase
MKAGVEGVGMSRNGNAMMQNYVSRFSRRVSERPGKTGKMPMPSARALVPFSFEPNPGSLVAKKFVPLALPAGAPLVVVLHGCTQTPEGYDRGTGWTALAERCGFAVLYVEQQRANNMNGCFNWFEPGDMRRDGGEPASIKAMIDQLVADHAIDPARIFITGLSAGAAMAGVMLATYPEVFAGGGLIAGLPYGVARSMPAAFSRMRSRGHESDAQLAALVRNASSHDGVWPTISVWHGTADMTVDASNADATVAQWRGVHGLADADVVEDLPGGHVHRVWRDASGHPRVEEYAIARMGHGTPLDVAADGASEIAGAYLLDVGVSSTLHLAAFWGLAAAVVANVPVSSDALTSVPMSAAMPTQATPSLVRPDVQKIIEDALRSAGLMR